MAYRKEIIVLSGGKHKGVVKLNSSVGHNGWLKGCCNLDFVPRDGVLYLVGDSTVDVPIEERDTSFEVRECAKGEISCVLLSSEPVLFGSTKQNVQRNSIIASVEKLKQESLSASAQSRTKSENIEPKQSRPQARETWPSQGQGSTREKTNGSDKKDDYYTKRPIDNDSKQKQGKEFAFGSGSTQQSKNNEYAPYSDQQSEKHKEYAFGDRANEKNNSNEKVNSYEKVGGEKPSSKNRVSGFSSASNETMSSADRVFAFDNGVRYEGHNFYLAIKPQIDEMFVCFPNEERLNAVVPNSKWVRVDTDDDFYVVGLLYDTDAPIFICYGIPGNYSIKPPEDLGDMCVWLPLNLSDKYGDGFWVIYQSAVDGKIVK